MTLPRRGRARPAGRRPGRGAGDPDAAVVPGPRRGLRPDRGARSTADALSGPGSRATSSVQVSKRVSSVQRTVQGNGLGDEVCSFVSGKGAATLVAGLERLGSPEPRAPRPGRRARPGCPRRSEPRTACAAPSRVAASSAASPGDSPGIPPGMPAGAASKPGRPGRQPPRRRRPCRSPWRAAAAPPSQRGGEGLVQQLAGPFGVMGDVRHQRLPGLDLAPQALPPGCLHVLDPAKHGRAAPGHLVDVAGPPGDLGPHHAEQPAGLAETTQGGGGARRGDSPSRHPSGRRPARG